MYVCMYLYMLLIWLLFLKEEIHSCWCMSLTLRVIAHGRSYPNFID